MKLRNRMGLFMVLAFVIGVLAVGFTSPALAADAQEFKAIIPPAPSQWNLSSNLLSKEWRRCPPAG